MTWVMIHKVSSYVLMSKGRSVLCNANWQHGVSNSVDNIAVYQLEAKRILELSSALRAGNVQLIQGRWQDGIVTTCAGKTLRLSLDDNSQAWLSKRGANSAEPLGVAWLDSSEGQQLLLVANQDFCRWEPKAGSL